MKKLICSLMVASLASSLSFSQEVIIIKGSDTLGAKMVPQLTEVYKKLGKKVSFDIAAEGSSIAFTSLGDGTADIGMSSRSVKQKELNSFKEKGKKLVEHVAGVDMIAVIVNKANKVKNLTKQQVQAIFTGKVTDWAQLGGKPGKIAIYTRNTSSGTYKTFQKLAMSKKDYAKSSQKMAGNVQIVTEVSKNPNGIGYVGLAYLKNKSIKAIKVDGVYPASKNAKKYAFARNLYYYTVGQPKGEVAAFLKWATTNKIADAIITKVGFIPAAK